MKSLEERWEGSLVESFVELGEELSGRGCKPEL